ncbi:DUF2357 domain-containing protein [Pseudomonas sp.]|uniref:DUF2357 domain-containing protein n=1 Tax=Pseudomonas sp. TaxID=306 RepID=UPI0028B16D1E|nr:DUF2357 domain-containing protein [Pseudomonas sp.]
MSIILQVEQGDARFDLHPNQLNPGFMERKAYRFTPLEGFCFYIDDVLIETVDQNGVCAWLWSPGFYAGEVAAELLDDQGRTAASFRLDVSAADNKLGGQEFTAMIEAILDFDPALVLGTEEAQFGIGHDGALTNPHLQYARLRRYGDRLQRALKQISQSPLTSLKSDRMSVSAHTVKRLDSASVRKALRGPAGQAILHPGSTQRPALNTFRFEVNRSYEEEDNPANQAVGLVLFDVLRRCRQVVKGLQHAAATEVASDTRSALASRLVRRIAFTESLARKLERLQRARPFSILTDRRLSAAGLNAISAHPVYARAFRFGWYALRSGWLGKDPDETLWISPTWEIYERWCFVTVVSQLQRQFPKLVWSREYQSVGLKEILWRGKAADITVEACYQVRCPAIDQAAHRGFQSLSRERCPDIVVTLESPWGKRFLVFDAKYRSARSSVLDAMESAHIYHDCLRWKGIKPDTSLLLIPRADEVPLLASPTYHSDYGIGAWQIGAESEGEALGVELKRILTSIPIAAAQLQSGATGSAS